MKNSGCQVHGGIFRPLTDQSDRGSVAGMDESEHRCPKCDALLEVGKVAHALMRDKATQKTRGEAWRLAKCEMCGRRFRQQLPPEEPGWHEINPGRSP